MLKTVFMGTPEMAVPSLKALCEDEDISVKLVVSMPDKPQGRGLRIQSPAVITFAKKNDLPFLQSVDINNDFHLQKLLTSIRPDIIIVFAFAQFLSEEFLTLPAIGCFNIHTSLLPKFRGASPIVHAILNGEKETGVSIQKMVKSIDAGDVAHTKTLPIGPRDTTEDLSLNLMNLAPQAFKEFKEKLVKGTLCYTPQNHKEASFAPTLKKEDGLLNVRILDFTQIDRMVRALYPWPGAYVFLNGNRLKIFKVQEDDSSVKPGEIDDKAEGLVIGHVNGALRALEVQLQGKKRCRDIPFLNGFKQTQTSLTVSTEQRL